MKNKFSIGSQKGIISVITVLFITFLVSIVIALAAIILPRLRISSEIKRSVGALYSADSAIEWCLYRAKDSNAANSPPLMGNSASFTLLVSSTNLPPSAACSTTGSPAVKAIGKYQGVTRSLEASGF